ncbi:MAG: CofH family radical SAM protein, partial [bacterium]
MPFTNLPANSEVLKERPWRTLAEKIARGKQLSPDEGLYLLRNADTHLLGRLADSVRRRLHPDNVAMFVLDANPNYTNVCETYCLFCAFYRTPKDEDKYTYTVDEMLHMMRKLNDAGATTVLLQGGHNPDLPLEYYTDLVRRTRDEIPGLHPHFFSASEVDEMAKVSDLSTREVLQRLYDAGLRTMPGGGAEILSDRVRKKISPLKIMSDDWIRIHREAHETGIKTTCTMMFGHLEEDEDIIEHLERVRALQNETGGFLAFIPWTFKPHNTVLERKVPDEVGGDRYLRVLALSRIYLDNFTHVQGSW